MNIKFMFENHSCKRLDLGIWVMSLNMFEILEELIMNSFAPKF